ncbi:MAG: methionine ABC transporter ATP-binding protein [Defluviitaleaceae bacterium]|nr:methionine ABC transporter ATP-binding protein [Defluviitaleaceae bacterium]
MLELIDVCKVYSSRTGSVEALRDINICFEKGDRTGIIGLSGAGKSTLVRCINLLERPTSGRILFNGEDVTGIRGKALREYRRRIGMIFQNFNLFAQRTVEKNVAFPLEVGRMPKSDQKKRVSEMLELVGLSEKARSYPAELSGGQRQRVSIARALAANPEILLCDEPTSALDSMTTKNILRLLEEINEKLGVTIIIITHEMHVVRRVCKKMAVIDRTSIIESGETKTLFTEAKSGITRSLLGLEDDLDD